MQRSARATLRTIALGLLFVAGSACKDGGATQGPALCDVPGSATRCAQSCSDDYECGDDYYCGGDGTCVADCSPTGHECGPSETCYGGRCYNTAADGGSGDAACAEVDVQVTSVFPDVQLLLDRSNSMSFAFGRINGQAVNRWQAMQHALTDSAVGVVSRLEDTLRFSAMMYKAGALTTDPCPILERTATAPSYQAAVALRQLFQQYSPQNGTPTAEAVREVVAEMKNWPEDPSDPRPKVLVIATDGDPNRCGWNSVLPDPLAQQQTESAVADAFSEGIRTFVLSVAEDVSVSHLARVANLGVGRPATPQDAPFFRGNNPEELLAAFDAIVRGVRSCEFRLGREIRPTNAARGSVSLDGAPLTYQVDWRLPTASTLQLQGEACDRFLAADEPTLSARFSCTAVVR